MINQPYSGNYSLWGTDKSDAPYKVITTTNLNYVNYNNDIIYKPFPLDIDKDIMKSEIIQLKKELELNKNIINRLEKLLNDFIDNPQKVKSIREMDPYGEEEW